MSKKKIQSHFESGALRNESEVTMDGIPDGYSRSYFESGQLERERFTLMGTFHGTWKQWNEQGLLLGEFKFVHGTGVLTEWYENGVKKYELELLKGAQHGAERLYDSDGRLCMTRYYFKNKRVSKKAYDIEKSGNQ